MSNERLRLLVKANELERVRFGVYMRPDEFLDKMFVQQLRRSKMIYSHGTALFLHELTDRDPISYTVTVPTGYQTAKLRDDGFRVFTVKPELHPLGITERLTFFGNSVQTYDLDRTICDCLRSRNQMDVAMVTDAIKRYVKRSDKKLHSLMHMAELFGVSKQIGNYLEVLL